METATQEIEPQKKSSLIRPILILVFVVFMLIAANYLGVGKWLEWLRQTIEAAGSWGPSIFILSYMVLTVAALPGSAMTLIAGALFGTVWGVIYSSIASTIGATLCFLIARYFAREAAAGWLGSNERFRKLDELTEQFGATIVALTRLVPVFPFNLLNYGFGLTKVELWTYVVWSWLCMLPGTVLYVAGADAVMQGLTEGKIPWPLIWILLITLVILTLIVRSARQRLRQKETRAKEERERK
ncbi:hypothetical protein GF373_02990 [bacterium]|nr:hypothetical protein [bacterium]